VRLSLHERDRLLVSYSGRAGPAPPGPWVHPLNYPEAVALITDHLMKSARNGRTVTELMSSGQQVPTRAEVMDGVCPRCCSSPGGGHIPGPDQARHRAPAHPMTGPEPVKVPITPGEVIPAEGSIEWPGPVETACTRSLDLDFVAVSQIAATGEKALETQAPATSFASSWPAATVTYVFLRSGAGTSSRSWRTAFQVERIAACRAGGSTPRTRAHAPLSWGRTLTP